MTTTDTESSAPIRTKALRIERGNVSALCARAAARSRRGDHSGAIADYTLALKKDRRDARTWNYRGNAWERKGDLARALRDYYQLLVKDLVSPVITPDGPSGPRFKFKPGAILLARISGRPLVPMAYAASRAWFVSWDKFVIPWPFARIAVAIGPPVHVPRTAAAGSPPVGPPARLRTMCVRSALSPGSTDWRR